jgi:hypothetical protein
VEYIKYGVAYITTCICLSNVRRKVMNRVQKTAGLLVVTISLGVTLSIAATSLLYVRLGMPRAWAGLAFLAVAGLGGLGPLVFKKDKGSVTCDERDRIINRRAALAAFTAAYLFVGLACMLPFFVLGPDGSISVTWLPMIFMGAGLITFFIHSAAILVQYGWRDKDGEK